GSGFYKYVDNTRVGWPEPAAPGREAIAAASFWIDPADGPVDELAAYFTSLGARLATSPENPETIIVIRPWGEDATHACVQRGLDARRCVALDPSTPVGKRRTLMLTCVTSPKVRTCAHAALAADGTPVTVINDSTGFIAQRVLATIVNIACDIVQRRIASVEDLETAIPLALGYPFGPLAWGDRLGAGRILQVLEAMLRLSGDPRYRPSPWLRRRASLGLPLTEPESPRIAEQQFRTAEQ